MAPDFERDVMHTLGRLENGVEGLLAEQKEQKAYIISVSRRVGHLELYRARVAGISAAVAAGVTFLLKAFVA